MKLVKLILSITMCLGVGVVGSYFTTPSITSWYAYLIKPSFSPPNYIFAPVWTTLYILMGLSFYLIWNSTAKKKYVKNALLLFIIHLIVNLSWSIVFFTLHQIFFAFITILLLWILVIILIIKFSKIEKKASLLLIPYLAWISFASILNFSIWYLNK